MTGYVRQSTADIIAGQDIKALPLANEFNALEAAFNSTTGHTHDGSTGNGPKISLTGSVSGILPSAKGGTGSNLSIVTGDLIVGNGTGTTERLAIGTSGYVLTSNGTTASWTSPVTTGGSFIDNTTFIVDDGDNTKRLAFQVSGVTTGTTRTMTIPNASGTLSLIDSAQTVTALNTVTLGNATTLTTYLEFTPSDYTTGKPKFYIQKSATASAWNLGLFDSTNNAGTINFVATTGLTWNSVQLVDLSSSQTLTTKILISPMINNATLSGTLSGGTFTSTTLTIPTVTGYTETAVTANTSTIYTIDITVGTVQILTLTGNCAYTFPTPTAGKSFLLIQKQDATGSRTASWPASVKWPSSTAPTITSTASKADIFAFTADGINWYGRVVGQLYL